MLKPQQPKVERRYLTQEFRVSPEGEAPKIAGYAAVFESQSEDMGFIEVIDPHAFDSIMAGDHDCRALWNHNPDVVLGRESAGTLTLTIDARGLAYVIDAPNTQAARDLVVSMRRKDIKESSFTFITARDQWTEMPDGSVQRRILEFEELLDVSPVTYPAFAQATAGVRSLPASMPTELRSKISKRAFGAGCMCGCPQCESESCTLCSNVDCNDPECCSCKQQSRSKPISESARNRMAMQIALLDLK